MSQTYTRLATYHLSLIISNLSLIILLSRQRPGSIICHDVMGVTYVHELNGFTRTQAAFLYWTAPCALLKEDMATYKTNKYSRCKMLM